MTQTRPPAEGARSLGLDEDDLVACVACGLCLPHCPTYRVTGFEIASPRGRIAAMRAVQLDGAPMDDAFDAAMEACVQCRGCEAACPSSVPFGALMEGTRAALRSERPRRHGWHRRVLEWIGYRVVLPSHRLLLAVTWPLALLRRIGLVPRRFGVPPLSLRPVARRLDAVPASDADVLLFTGCVMDAWQRDVHRAALEVLRAIGAAPAVSDSRAACCGALHLHAGRLDEARGLAQRVIDACGDLPVVVDSAGCGAAMKDYGHVLDTPEARAFAARVFDFSEWVARRGVPATTPQGVRVVIQDPCHLRHVQRKAGAVPELLAAAYDVVATDDDGLCCGAGGAYAVTEPALAGEIRTRKIAALRAAAGDAPLLVVSANPGCAMHLGAAGLDVRHPAELLADALVEPKRPRSQDTEQQEQQPADE